MPQNDLAHRLDAYGATLRASSRMRPFGDALRRSVENWQTYAAVTGAAMAMATNASAGIIYSGTLDTKVSVQSAKAGSILHSSKKIELKNSLGASINVGFNVDILQRGVSALSRYGGIGIIKATQVDFLMKSSSLAPHRSAFVKRLSSGGKISHAGNTATASLKNGFIGGNVNHGLANRDVHTSTYSHHVHKQFVGWSKTEGFAAFSFKTAGHQTDFGWVRLQYTVGANSLINSLTVVDWGYATGGVSINAGQGVVSGVPEPSTLALTLLAAGAAGVGFLRRRREPTGDEVPCSVE